MASLTWLLLLLVLGLAAATDLHNSLINSSTLEVNEPRREEKERKVKTARPRDPLVVHTNSGFVRGFRRNVLGKDLDTFYGIPFAKPPLGELRYKKPVQVDPWSGILEADKLPKTCVQEPYNYFPGFKGEEMWNPNTNLSEDCLYLNIWAPAHLRDSGSEPTEVLVWIYGGGYMGGTSTLEVYDADIMAVETNMIVTSMQYRCGAFGYLYLDMEDAPGNQGMYDQALAFAWIKENIEFFGGDPSKLTLFGESAGAGSIAVHLLSPVSMHLFNRAVLQSGVINAPWSIMAADKAYKIGLTLVDDLGCNSSLIKVYPDKVMECMRKADAAQVSLLQWNSYFGIMQFPSTPIVDGIFLPDDPLQMMRSGKMKKTQIMLGSNLDEGTFFMLYDYLDYFKRDEATFLERQNFLKLINSMFDDRTELEREAIVFQYTNWDEVDNGFKNQKALGDLVGDYFFICPHNLFAETYAQGGGTVYYYFFTHRTSSNPWGEWMGVLHADEIDYVYGLPLNGSLTYTNKEVELSRSVMGYYKLFSSTGRPVPENVEWPHYTAQEPQYFEWSTKGHRLGVGPRSTHCAFWNQFMPVLKQKQDGWGCQNEMMASARSTSAGLSPATTSLLLLLLRLF